MTVTVQDAKMPPTPLLHLNLVRAVAFRKPKLGTMKGQIIALKGWDKPLSAKQADAFLEGR